MTIRPEHRVRGPEGQSAFYVDVLGFEVPMDMGWIVTFPSPENLTARISVLRPDAATTPQPVFTMEVMDVDATHARVLAHGHPAVCPRTDGPWDVRRFLRDSNGRIVNIMRHQSDP